MTDKEAIEATIKHWREDYKQVELFGGAFTEFGCVFGTDSCPLCCRHARGHRRYRHDDHCGRCPLKPRDGSEGCTRPGQPYSRALLAARAGNKPAVMAARRALLKRLYRALAKHE